MEKKFLFFVVILCYILIFWSIARGNSNAVNVKDLIAYQRFIKATESVYKKCIRVTSLNKINHCTTIAMRDPKFLEGFLVVDGPNSLIAMYVGKQKFTKFFISTVIITDVMKLDGKKVYIVRPIVTINFPSWEYFKNMMETLDRIEKPEVEQKDI